jgi:hypothetical protein
MPQGIEKISRDRMRKSLNDITDSLIWVVKELQMVNKVLDTLEARSSKKKVKVPLAQTAP